MKKIPSTMKNIIISLALPLTFFITSTTVEAGWSYNSSLVAYEVVNPSAISVSISASPTSITLPSNQTNISWVINVGTPSSCTASGSPGTSWNGARSTSGGGPEPIVGLVAGNYIFNISCTDGFSTGNDSVLVTVSSTPPPTGTISATDCTIVGGASTCNSSVSWSTSNLSLGSTTEVTRNNPSGTHVSWATSATNLSNTVNYGVSTYFLYNDAVQLAQASMTASCTSGTSWNGTVCQNDAPTVSLMASPSTVFSGGSSTLSWTSTAVTSCTASANPLSFSWTGSRPTNSSLPHESTGALNATTTFTLSCTGPGGSASSSKIVTVVPNQSGSDVIADLVANPDRINSGDPSTLSWSSSNATSCSGIGFSTGGATSGSIVVSPTVNTTYTLNCTNSTSSASDQATIMLKRKFLFIEF